MSKATGTKRGKRPRFYICTALKSVKGEPQLIKSRVYFHPEGSAKVLAKYPDLPEGIWAEPTADLTSEEAANLFKAAKKLAPLDIEGPLFDFKGNGTQDKQRVIVSLKGSDIRFSRKVWEAKFKDWDVMAHGLLGCTAKNGDKFGDNDLVQVHFDEDQVLLDEDGKKIAKPRFGSMPIRFSELENAKPVE